VKTLIALAIASFALAACSSAEKEKQRELGFTHSEQSLEAAQHSATIACADPAQCDAIWKLTKTYVEQNSKQRLTRADDAVIQTDVPYDSGKPVFSATRVANAGGSGAVIALYAQCRGMYGPERARGSDYDDCAEKILKAQNGFQGYLQAHLTPSGS
jgi:hypothetical protein